MYLECSECDIKEADVPEQCEYKDSLLPLQFG